MSRVSILLASIALSASSGSLAACSGSQAEPRAKEPAGPAEAALDTYRDFLEARASASNLSDLDAFMPSRTVEMLGDVPAGQLEMMEKSILSPPNAATLVQPSGDFALVSAEQEGQKMTLVLDAVSESAGVRETLRRNVKMVQETDGWKIDDPRPKSWRSSGRMPVDLSAPATPGAQGPGAMDWSAQAPSRDTLTLVAETSFPMRQSATSNEIIWDPRGHTVAVGSMRRFNFLSLPDLSEVWAVEANSGGFASTISADGGTLMQGEKALPLPANIEAARAPDQFFFVKPVFDGVVAERGSMPRFSEYRFNPRLPVLALVAGDKIYFQPSEPPLWSDDGPSADIEAWSGDGNITKLVWSGDGSRIAWVNGYGDLGTPISVRSYPDGAQIQSLSADDIRPGPILFSPDGRYLATTGSDGEQVAAFVWDLETGDLAGKMPGIRHAAFTGDGDAMFAVRSGGMSSEEGVTDTILLWKPGASEPEGRVAEFPKGDFKFPAMITALATSPNGRYLAATATNRDGEKVRDVRLWELASQ